MRIRINRGTRRNAKKWAKVITGIDRAAKGGYAIEGEFFDLGAEVEVAHGSVVCWCDSDDDVWVGVVDPDAPQKQTTAGIAIQSRDANEYWNLRTELPTLLDVIESALANTDPRADAMAMIKLLMTEHSISVNEIAANV